MIKWSYTPYKCPYKSATGVKTHISGVATLVLTSRGLSYWFTTKNTPTVEVKPSQKHQYFGGNRAFDMDVMVLFGGPKTNKMPPSPKIHAVYILHTTNIWNHFVISTYYTYYLYIGFICLNTYMYSCWYSRKSLPPKT